MTANDAMALTQEKILNSEKPSVFFEELRQNNQLDEWFPELGALIGVPQNKEHHKEGDVWTHTMMVIDEAAKKREIVKNQPGFMFAALCHDFGKAVCTEEINGVIHAYKHESEGLPLVQTFLERLGAETGLIKYVLNMVNLHMQPNIMAAAKSKVKSTNKLFDSSAEPFDLIQLGICDGLGKIPQRNDTEDFLIERYKLFVEIMARPYVTEADLSAAGIRQGSQLSEVLAYSHKMRLAGCDKENSLRQSLAYARKVLKINGVNYKT